jgi:uncharacterized protein YjiS (DUF1127 family)
MLVTCILGLAALQQDRLCSAPDVLILMTSNSGGCRERTYQMLASIIRLFQAWKRYADAVQELSHLSDRELADIGVNRSEIQRLAWQHAHSA